MKENPYLLPEKVYHVLKWVAIAFLPAFAVFYSVIAPAWGLPNAEAVVVTSNSLGVFIAVIIGASEAKARIVANKEVSTDETSDIS